MVVVGIAGKLRGAATTIWNHKKKTLVLLAASAYGASWAVEAKRDADIRRCYALEARRYGDLSVRHPLEKARKVMVLLNKEANGGKVKELFKKNALPLLHLSGLDVDIVEVKSAEEMQSLGKVMDTQDADCVYLVGGDGTLMRYISGIFDERQDDDDGRRRAVQTPPLGIFPGGRENRSLAWLAPQVFKGSNNVRSYCESAMALIEYSVRNVSPTRCEIIEETKEPQISHLLGDIRAGWFEHCELRKWKLWYWGRLRGYLYHFLEFMKRRPEAIKMSVQYKEHCEGCNKCKEPVKPKEKPKWSWLNIFVLPKRVISTEQPIDYSKIVNENCAMEHSIGEVNSADLVINGAQTMNGSKLQFQAGGESLGRVSGVVEGWRRCSKKEATPGFYGKAFEAGEISLHIENMPTPIQKISVSGDWVELERPNGTKIGLKATDKRIPIFLPLKKREFENII